MKHVVTLTTSNPSHEHVSLRRRQSTTNFMVEAADEDQAIFRATAHFRKLGHYIHEAKIFKKKDQLNEFVNTVTKPFDKETNTGAVIAGNARHKGTTQQQVDSNKYFDPRTQEWIARGPNQSDQDWEAQKKQDQAEILQWTDQPVEPIFPELNLIGGIQRAGSSVANMLRGAVPKRAPIPRRAPTPQRRTPERKPGQFPGMPQPGPRRERPTTKPKEEPVPTQVPETKPAPAPAPAPAPVPKPAPTPAPGPVTLPPVPVVKPPPVPSIKPKPVPQTPVPNKPPVPGTAPIQLPNPIPVPGTSPKPSPMPAPKTEPAPSAQPKPAPDTAEKIPNAEPMPGLSPVPRINPLSPPKPKPGSSSRPTPRPWVSPFAFDARLGNRGDEDIGTLGQYRGMAPMYQHYQFNEENKAMNAIGRVIAKRKQLSKDQAESEKNKINMEPKLKTK